MSQDNFNVLQAEALIDECLIAKKIYGRCKQQDCLRPVDCSHPKVPFPDGVLPPEIPDFIKIDSSILGTGPSDSTTTLANSSTPTGNPTPLSGILTAGDTLAFDDTVKSISIAPNTLFNTSIYVLPIAPQGQFGLPGFYDVTVQYVFSYTLNLNDASNNAIYFLLNGSTTPTTAVPAYTTYTKLISLEGGVVDQNTVVAIADTGSSPTSYSSPTNNVPYAYVQAIAQPLVAKVGKYIVPPTTGTVCTTEYHADVVVGLFTIIELYRITNMTVASSGPIEVPQCQPSIINDPCSGFNQLLFPYDDFDPPYRKC